MGYCWAVRAETMETRVVSPGTHAEGAPAGTIRRTIVCTSEEEPMHHEASTDRHTGRCDGEADAGGCSDTTGPADPQSETSRDGPPSVSVQDALGVDDEPFAGGSKDRREVCDGESLSKDEAQRRSTVPQQPLAAVPCVFGPRF